MLARSWCVHLPMTPCPMNQLEAPTGGQRLPTRGFSCPTARWCAVLEAPRHASQPVRRIRFSGEGMPHAPATDGVRLSPLLQEWPRDEPVRLGDPLSGIPHTCGWDRREDQRRSLPARSPQASLGSPVSAAEPESGRISMRHPVRRAASRAFCPSLPMANESW